MNLLKNKELIFDSLNLVNKCINAKEKDSGELAFDTLKLLGKTIQSSQEQTTKTMFYNDNNFFEKMKNSKYTRFINKLKNLNIPIDEYKLPIIVNIGNESSGKSSLIRNILKCDIFPIDKNMCTKCPIKIELFNSNNEEYIITFKNDTIKLSDKEKTKLHVSAIMNKINDIIEDELYIKISNEYVINSTFYDLPGIIEYPADMREKSKTIINKYINQPNTLIICVIPANTTRLTANQALGMVNDAKKTKDCIIALTMVDLLHNDDIELFIDRVLMKNNEIKSLNIKKIIGVISHKNKDINENIWFENNILKEIIDISLKKEISKNITLEKLLISVDEMFNDFINTNWKNDAINKTNKQILKLENELNDLGKDITLSELLDFIKTNSNFNRLFEPRLAFIDDGSSNSIQIDKYEYDYNNYLKYNQDMEHITNKYEEYKKNIINSLVNNINNLFEINNQYKLIRFEKLRHYLCKEYSTIVINHFKHIDIWFKSYLDKFKYEYRPDELRKFQIYIMDNFIRYIRSDIYFNDNPLNINDTILSDLLIEKDEWKSKRNTLNISIKNYKKHKTFFENL